MADRTASVGKVHRNSKGQPKSLQLGEHTFNLVDGAKQQHPVLVVDGWPGITIATVDGKKWVALEPVQVRNARNKDDSDESRSRALRLFPEGSPGYNATFPRRNDIESMHRHLKDLMFNDRVSTVGDRSLRIWLHTYQTRLNRTALIAWHYRTGGDISEWFGEWKPPPQRRTFGA